MAIPLSGRPKQDPLEADGGEILSVLISDVLVYGCALMPEADGVAVGGAVDTTKRVDFSDLPLAGTLDVVSTSPTDTATQCKYTVRDPTGALQTQTLTVNGTTPVIGSQSSERILYALLSGAGANGPTTPPAGTVAIGDVALAAHSCAIPTGSVMSDATTHQCQAAGSANHVGTTPALVHLAAGDGTPGPIAVGQIIWTRGGTGPNQLRRIIAIAGYGTDIVAVSRDWSVIPDNSTTYKILNGVMFDISPNPVTTITRLFVNAASNPPLGGTITYYEKVFDVNNNVATSFTSAQLQVASEAPTLPISPAITLDMALTNGLNDTGTVANRQTAPVTGVGAFVPQPSAINIPAPGNLPAGVAPNAAGAQGVWLRLTLAAGAAAYKGTADIRTGGITT
jgi:hypothetical protein